MPLRPLVLAPLVLLLATSCGGDRTGSITGEVSDVTDRLCITTHDEATRCFDATPSQLDGLSLGSCLKVSYRAATAEVGRVVTTEPRSAPCS